MFSKSCMTVTSLSTRGNIRFIDRYFPRVRIRKFPKMAHAELVIIHPEEFCRYAEEFLMG